MVKFISKKFDLDDNISKNILDEIFNHITEKLAANRRIEIRNFGSFQITRKKNNLNWINKYSLCKQDHYNVINFKMSKSIHQKLNKIK